MVKLLDQQSKKRRSNMRRRPALVKNAPVKAGGEGPSRALTSLVPDLLVLFGTLLAPVKAGGQGPRRALTFLVPDLLVLLVKDLVGAGQSKR